MIKYYMHSQIESKDTQILLLREDLEKEKVLCKDA